MLSGGRISHAFLLTGPRGIGKTTIARILAKAINCEKYQKETFGEPCNECATCVSINSASFLDLIEIDAASNRGIDDIRDLREKIKLSPASARFKVYIIDEVHMLTTEAFNALLKTLEEPPKHAIFILCTTEPQKLPETIISRCQRFDFKRPTVSELSEHIEEIAKFIGLDSLHYLSLNGMVEATGMEANNFCLSCYNGRYPISPPEDMGKFCF